MQVRPPAGGGSFGIPPEMKEAHQRQLENAAKSSAPETAAADGTDFGFDAGQEEETPVAVSTSTQEIIGETADPVSALKKLGITLKEEDFHQILFRGELEKEVELFPAIGGKSAIRVTLKTLTAEEYDWADELLAQEVRDTPLTNEGYATRKSMGILAFGVVKNQGQPLPRTGVPMKDKVVDYRALAQLRRSEFKRWSPALLTKMIRIHTVLTLAINFIVDDPKDENLKKL